MKTTFTTASVLSLLALALGSGCAVKSTSTNSTTGSGSDAVDQGSDVNDAEGSAESLGSSLVGGTSGSLHVASAGEMTMHGGTLQLADVGAEAKGFYSPAGCLTVAADLTKSSAKYTFNDCTGPWGILHLTGEVDVTWSSSGANQITINYSATALKVNHATIDWTATANVTGNGGARDMIWDGKFSGTTAHGRAFQRTNHKEYKWTVGQACLSVSGTSDGTVTGHELKTEVKSFSICAGGCPEAGSEITITDVTTSKVYDVKWNAGSATYTDPAGNSVTYTPLCAR